LVLGRGRGFDIDPGQKASVSLPPEARVQIKRPSPSGEKVETVKSFKKKEMHLNVRLPSLHAYSFDYYDI